VVLAELIVHIPEHPLRPGELGSLCRTFRHGLHLGLQEVPEHEPQPVPEVRLHPLT